MGIKLWNRRRKESSVKQQERTSSRALPGQQSSTRRFLENSYYLLPKDAQEINRLDFQHFLLRRLLGGNYVAPIPPSTRSIVDIGCGTGLWVREMAQQFPGAQIVGLDLEPCTVPDMHPANCWFVSGNILQGLPFSNGSFAFVHQRLLVAALPTQTWPQVVKELARITEPSGWVEIVEIGQSMTNPGPAMLRYLHWWTTFSERIGFDTTVVEHPGALLHQAGLQHVQQRRITAPAGMWGGHAGTLLATNMLEVFSALKPRLCSDLDLSPALFDKTLDILPAEWETYHTAFHFYLAYGQKEADKAEQPRAAW